MLINLSNHAQKFWSEKQKRAARQYGNIVDVPFPAVDPHADLAAIRKLAQEYAQRCRQILAAATDAKHAIHIMGEMTFVYQFIRQMHREVLCLAATGVRDVKDEFPDGGKISYFQFVQFRPYEI